MERTRIGRALAVIATAVTVVVGMVGMVASPPVGAAQTPPWGTFAATGATSTGGSPNGVVLVGDSLIQWSPNNVTTTANAIRTATGYATYVNAAAAAQWVTYGWPGQQNGNALIWDYAAFLNARLTIGALATNDATIMTSNPGSYSQSQQYAIMSNAVIETLEHSECVLLVNVRRRSVPAFTLANAQKVNDNMTWLAAVTSGNRVHVANWNAHAAGHDADWFNPGDVHLNAAGVAAYNAFIASEADRLIDDEGC